MWAEDRADQHDAFVSLKWNEPVELVLLAIEYGWATVQQLREAVAICRSKRPRIGELAVQERKLTVSQVFRVLEYEATHGGLFGENALKLNFLTNANLYELLRVQTAQTPKVWQVLLENGVITEQQLAKLLAEVQSTYNADVMS